MIAMKKFQTRSWSDLEKKFSDQNRIRKKLTRSKKESRKNVMPLLVIRKNYGTTGTHYGSRTPRTTASSHRRSPARVHRGIDSGTKNKGLNRVLGDDLREQAGNGVGQRAGASTRNGQRGKKSGPRGVEYRYSFFIAPELGRYMVIRSHGMPVSGVQSQGHE